LEKGLVLYMGPEYPKHIERYLSIIWIPIISIEPINGCSKDFLTHLETCDCIAFTSPRGPRVLAEDAMRHGIIEYIKMEVRGKRVAVVGSRTWESFEKHFDKTPDIIPRKYQGLDLALELIKQKCQCVLLARSLQGLKDINYQLRESGITYVETWLYREEVKEQSMTKIKKLLEGNDVRYVILSSPIISRNFCKHFSSYLKDVRIVAIGPSSLNAAKEICKNKNIIVPRQYSLEGVAELMNAEGI